jgi:hypothetical protein
MLDGVSLDQLRIFVAAADEGDPDAEPPGAAGRWMIKRLKSCPEKVTAEKHIDSGEYL